VRVVPQFVFDPLAPVFERLALRFGFLDLVKDPLNL
jgi:hypothetical protein